MSKTVQPKTEKKKETNKIDQSNTDYIIFMAACLFLSSLCYNFMESANLALRKSTVCFLIDEVAQDIYQGLIQVNLMVENGTKWMRERETEFFGRKRDRSMDLHR